MDQIEEQIKQEETSEQLVPPKLPPKREQQGKQDEADARAWGVAQDSKDMFSQRDRCATL